MAGSFEFESGGQSLSWPAEPTAVYRYDPDAKDDNKQLVPLPNVQWEQVDARVGAEPATAQLRYALDDAAAVQGFPTQVEQLWPIDATGKYVVKPDDRLIILGWLPDGTPDLLFDGFAQIPRATISASNQDVRFTATDVAARLWDMPIGGRIQRHANEATDPDSVGIQTDLPTRFNPTDTRGIAKKNCVPDDAEVHPDDSGIRYPIFLDSEILRTPDPRTAWTLSGAIRYLLATQNDEKYVKNPDFSDLDDKLKVRKPKAVDDEGEDTYDPSDPETYDAEEITIRDYDATNKPWPEAVADLLSYSGFEMRFVWGLDEDGLPRHEIQILRHDESEAIPKEVWMDAQGSDIDPARNTVNSLNLARDMNGLVNAFSVETKPKKVECCVVLACGYVPVEGDEVGAAREAFKKSHLQSEDTTTEALRKYRYYVADEAGDGHWEPEIPAPEVPEGETPGEPTPAGWTTTKPMDLSPIFPPDDDGTQSYVRRLRPGDDTLNSRDDSDRPMKATLHWSQDYEGGLATVWDGTGTWYAAPTGWDPLDDRLGIKVTVEDPEAWGTGKNKAGIQGVTWQAKPPEGKRFTLRLTTVIDDDIMLDAHAEGRIASPTKFVRMRRVDARDHFELLQVHKSSPFFKAPEDDPESDIAVIRDDSEKAIAHAEALRTEHEMPKLAGTLAMPGLPSAILPGDFVSRINGRNISLATSTAKSQGEGPRYPMVVAIQWTQTDGGQHTVIQLADRRAEVPRV